MNPIRIAAVAALVLLVAALAGVGRPEEAHSDEGAPDKGITVTATGTVESIPDTAALEIGVETQAPSAKAALAQNAERVRRVIDALRNAGVGKGDLQTRQVSLWPDRREDGTTITGYRATNTVLAELDVEKAGGAVDAAVAAGANVVSGPALAVEKREALYREALGNAVKAAKAEAEAIAEAAGVAVGRVTTVVESGDYSQPPMPYFAEARAAAPDTSIEPGKQQIDATVTVTFAVG